MHATADRIWRPRGEGPGVRMDKWLQISRLVKRRTLAKELCDQGRVCLNGRTAKSAAAVVPGDVIEIDYGWRRVTVRVASVPAGPLPKAAAAAPYELVSPPVSPSTPSPP